MSQKCLKLFKKRVFHPFKSGSKTPPHIIIGVAPSWKILHNRLAFLEKSGIIPFVTSHLKGRFFVFFTVNFLLFLASAGGSNPAGQLPNPVGLSYLCSKRICIAQNYSSGFFTLKQVDVFSALGKWGQFLTYLFYWRPNRGKEKGKRKGERYPLEKRWGIVYFLTPIE